ncbi:hypothetical protein [Variovorax sp. W2I14]|uniref:hypothetical protein n=1 Tax=Variovorax sp. W2I14 TaxID=3042290 RepID=UPI003D23DE10
MVLPVHRPARSGMPRCASVVVVDAGDVVVTVGVYQSSDWLVALGQGVQATVGRRGPSSDNFR